MERGNVPSYDPMIPAPSLEQIEAAALSMDTRFYVQEALNAGCDYNYFDNSPASEREEGTGNLQADEREANFPHSSIASSCGDCLEEVTTKSEAANAQLKVVRAHVYLSWGPKLEA
jgi:hypothetical protein